jgi:hypothetical protein
MAARSATEAVNASTKPRGIGRVREGIISFITGTYRFNAKRMIPREVNPGFSFCWAASRLLSHVYVSHVNTKNLPFLVSLIKGRFFSSVLANSHLAQS